MKSFRILIAATALFVPDRFSTADEDVAKPSTEILQEIVNVARENYEKIETLTAIYEWRSSTAKRDPSNGEIHFVWDQKQKRFRSNFHTSAFDADTITTPSEFVRLGPAKPREFPASESRKYWSADVLSPARLFGTQDRPLWESLDAYTRWPEANDRITITSSGAADEIVYTMRMAYISNVSDEKLFVTRKLQKKNAFNPSLIVRSSGTDQETASVIDVTSWTYKTIDGCIIPRSITHSRFDEVTGAPVTHKSLHLRIAKLNRPLDEAAFDYEVALTVNVPTPSHTAPSGRFSRSGVHAPELGPFRGKIPSTKSQDE